MIRIPITPPPDLQRGVFTVYGRSDCEHCDLALKALSNRTVNYRSIQDPEHKTYLVENGYKTVPQIWHGTHMVGGYDNLVVYLNG